MYDPRVGRFFAADPLNFKYPHYSPYSFAGNKVIQFVELEGLEEGLRLPMDGSVKLEHLTWENFKKNAIIKKFTDTHHRAEQMAEFYKNHEHLLNGSEKLTLGATQVYFFSYFTEFGGFTDAEDVSVLTEGRTIDGEDAGILDYSLAGVGAFIPFVSGGAIKNIFKVSADVANAKHIERGWDAPFDATEEIYDAVLKADEQFVRVYSSKLGNKTGDFLVKAEEIAGLNPTQIKDRLALDYVPDMMVDVNVPSGTTIRSGVAAERKSVSALGGGNQIQLQERIDDSNFTNARKIDE